MNLSFSNIDNVIFHPCIQAADLQSSKKIIFSPPLDPFPLCNFRVKKTNIFPLRGFYQMKVCFIYFISPYFILFYLFIYL